MAGTETTAGQTMQPMGDMAPTGATAKPCALHRPKDTSGPGCLDHAVKRPPALMVRVDQFLIVSTTSGPRGQTRVTGPGSLMLMYEKELSSRNTFRLNLMASAEQLTVGKIGTPQLLQTENLDAMHAHDTIMALELRDTFKLGASKRQELTFLFAPRGAASAGPVTFMHRPSAEGNPDSPLGHNLQDGFHDVSTVVGVGYRVGRTFAEATLFSGKPVSWPLPLHRPDSFGLRLTRGIDDHANIGASYADVLTPGDNGDPAKHERFVSAWLATDHKIHGGIVRSSLIWGQLRSSGRSSQNSLLAEAVFQRRADNIFGRAEILQTTPEQLSLVQFKGSERARWIEAVTLGYERSLLKRGPISLFGGGSLTKDFVPRAFEGDYGSHLGGAKLFLRIKFESPTGMTDGM